jgi:hypothetical protein
MHNPRPQPPPDRIAIVFAFGLHIYYGKRALTYLQIGGFWNPLDSEAAFRGSICPL